MNDVKKVKDYDDFGCTVAEMEKNLVHFEEKQLKNSMEKQDDIVHKINT